MVAFLDRVNTLVGRGDLFKQSLLLIKAWCLHESSRFGVQAATSAGLLPGATAGGMASAAVGGAVSAPSPELLPVLGSKHGGLSTTALNIMVVAIFVDAVAKSAMAEEEQLGEEREKGLEEELEEPTTEHRSRCSTNGGDAENTCGGMGDASRTLPDDLSPEEAIRRIQAVIAPASQSAVVPVTVVAAPSSSTPSSVAGSVRAKRTGARSGGVVRPRPSASPEEAFAAALRRRGVSVAKGCARERDDSAQRRKGEEGEEEGAPSNQETGVTTLGGKGVKKEGGSGEGRHMVGNRKDVANLCGIESPLHALVLFFQRYADFPWDTHVAACCGAVPISDDGVDASGRWRRAVVDVLVGAVTTDASICASSASAASAASAASTASTASTAPATPAAASTFARGGGGTGLGGSAFPLRRGVNVVDPIMPTNNVGRSVSADGFHRLVTALQAGRRELAAALGTVISSGGRCGDSGGGGHGGHGGSDGCGRPHRDEPYRRFGGFFASSMALYGRGDG
jgi:hypothetical protein